MYKYYKNFSVSLISQNFVESYHVANGNNRRITCAKCNNTFLIDFKPKLPHEIRSYCKHSDKLIKYSFNALPGKRGHARIRALDRRRDIDFVCHGQYRYLELLFNLFQQMHLLLKSVTARFRRIDDI